MGPSFPYGMNEYHHRGIETALGLLAEALCEFEGWARGREAHAALYHERNGLADPRRAAILSQIDQMRKILSQLQHDLELKDRVCDSTGQIWGRCSVLWESLVELEGSALNRYGSAPPGLSAYLDPQLAELTRRLRLISAAARGVAQEQTPDGQVPPGDTSRK